MHSRQQLLLPLLTLFSSWLRRLKEGGALKGLLFVRDGARFGG